MMLAARMRNWGFQAADLLQGSPLRKHCEDIEWRLADGPPATDRLESLLRFAVAHSPFYADRRGFGSLQDFPVIHRALLKSEYNAFRTNAFPERHLTIMRTSGSTGTPLAVPQDPDKRRRVLAEMITFGRRAGYRVGDRYVFTRVWNRHNRKPWHVALRENAILFDISSLEEARMEALRRLLREDRGLRCLIGYPSTFGPLLRILEQHGDGPDAFHLRSVISISERLPDEMRKALRVRFGCTVVSRYSNQENGVLAQQCPGQDEYHLNTASFVFEFLDLDRDCPAEPGARARVVVTDLFNRALPLIRYDTGDVVVPQPAAACGEAPETLRDVEGRRLDFLYDTGDRLVSPVVVVNHFWPFTRLRQYQVVQVARGRYQVVLNGARGHYPDTVFVDLLKELLGADAQVAVAHVEGIPLLASGKFMTVVNRYRPRA